MSSDDVPRWRPPGQNANSPSSDQASQQDRISNRIGQDVRAYGPNGVEWLYQHIDASKLCFKALLYYLEGLMVPSDMPGEVMKGVIERAEEAATKFYAEDTEAKRAKKPKADKGGRGHNE